MESVYFDKEQAQIDWKARYESLKEAYVSLEFVMKGMEQAEQLNEQQLAAWQNDKVVQQRVIVQQLAQSDDRVRELQDEIIKLRAEIKQLKNDDNNRLADTDNNDTEG